jgi:ABC-type uncharacterized transport system permease subunit
VFSKAFWLSTTERAVKTFVQALLAVLTIGPAFNILHANWSEALGVSLGATVLSILTSLASAPVGAPGSASMVRGRHEAE